MIGIDTGEFERLAIEVGAREGFNVARDGFPVTHVALFVDVQCNRGDFQQGVAFGIETSGLDINDNRKKPAKAPCHG